MSFVYLASPYTDPDPIVREERYQGVLRVLASFLKDNYIVYSPVVHAHCLATKFDMPKDFAFWRQHDLAMLRMASSFWILQLSGWDKSKGISYEHAFARSLGIPTLLIANVSPLRIKRAD